MNNNAIKNSQTNKRNTWKYFESHGYKEHKKMVLHHIDTNLKYTNPERYNEWRITDVIPMPVRAHRALHQKLAMKNIKRTKQHNQKISNGLNNSIIRGKKIKIHRSAIKEDTQIFSSLADAAKYIGCSRQMVSQCLNPKTRNKKAMGYKIEIID